MKSGVKDTKTFRSLTVTLAVYFLALSTLVLFLAVSLQLFSNIQIQRKVITSQQQLIAKEAAHTVESFVQERLRMLESSVSLGHLANFEKEAQKAILDRLLGLEPAFRQLALLNAKSQEVVSVSRLSNLVSSGFTKRIDSNIFLEVSKGMPHIGQIYIDEVTSEPLVIMAVPVRDIFGDFKGVLIAELNLKFMWDLVGRIKVGDKGLAYVVNRQGNLIAAGDISRVLKGENLRNLDEVAEFMNSKIPYGKASTRVSKGIKGDYVVSSYVQLGNPDWAVVVESPLLEAYAEVIQVLKLSALIVLLSFALAIVTGIYLAKRITRPISNLRESVLRIGAGKLDTQIKIETDNEIGDLARTFDQMLRDLQQTTTSIDSLNKEIIERKKAEEAVRLSEERFQDIAGSTGDWIWEIDVNGRYTYSSAVVEKILGYTAEEVTGKYFYDFFHPNDRERLKQGAFEAFAKKEAFKDFPNMNIRKDGQVVILETSGVPLIDANGELIGFRGVDRDVTERKKAEEDLTQLLSLHDATLEATADGILVVDLTGKVVSYNNKFLQLWRVPDGLAKMKDDEKLLAHVMDQLVDPGAFLSEVLRLYDHPDEFSFDTLLFKDGRFFERLSQPQKIGTKIVGRVWSFRDVTKRQQAEEMLKKAHHDLEVAHGQLKESAEQLVQTEKLNALGELAAGIAHELNQPLNVTTIICQSILRDIQKERFSLEEAKKELPEIINQMNRMSEIISHMRIFTRRTDGSVFERHDISTLVQNALQMTRQQLKNHGITLVEELSAGLPLVMADQIRIEQVVINLINNARYAVEKSGKTERTIQLKTYRGTNSNEVVFEIFDNGNGISDKLKHKVFQPFFTTKDPGEGTGLGLSVSHKIITEHKGRLEFDSREGEWTVFRVILPAEKEG